MTLPLTPDLKIGFQTIVRQPSAASGPWQPRTAEIRTLVERLDDLGFDSLFAGDHLSYGIPILDPFIQLAQAATFSERLLVGTCVYLLPLRHPATVAKQVASLDLLSGGRLIFGVGIGGEFPAEFALAGVAREARGERLSEGLRVLRKLWSGEEVDNEDGRHFPFPPVTMLPAPTRPGGPPVWCGGRRAPALRRAGAMADGYVSYLMTPEQLAAAIRIVEDAYGESGRALPHFDTAHVQFLRIGESYEAAFRAANAALSTRWKTDFTRATERYVVIGTPAQVAERIEAYRTAGMRHLILDFVGPYTFEDRADQLQRFAEEVRPLLGT